MESESRVNVDLLRFSDRFSPLRFQCACSKRQFPRTITIRLRIECRASWGSYLFEFLALFRCISNCICNFTVCEWGVPVAPTRVHWGALAICLTTSARLKVMAIFCVGGMTLARTCSEENFSSRGVWIWVNAIVAWEHGKMEFSHSWRTGEVWYAFRHSMKQSSQVPMLHVARL
jgi:hypothetical protein